MSVERQWVHEQREGDSSERNGVRRASGDPAKDAAILATALRRAQLDGSVELIAAAACNELGTLHGSLDLALHAFVGEGLTECLAEHRRGGETTPGGRPLSSETAGRAYQRAGGGAWLETTHAGLVHARDTAALLSGPRAAAWVPLTAPDQILGVIIISADGSVADVTRRLSEAMATAAELAPTISSLLGPGLDSFNGSEERRARLQRVLDGTFFPVFQPIMELGDRRVKGYEALTRFEDGAPPESRLAEAASLGGLVPLEAALCRAALGAVPHLPGASWIAVNASPSLLLDTATLHDLVCQHHGPPVVLEITEHERIHDYSAVRRAVEELGVEIRLSIDDVGDRWSCLQHILDLQPSFIKIDTSWVRGIEGDPTRQALVRGLSQFSKRNGCELIAEGIETERQLETLLQLEVGLGQGFHLGRPSRADGYSRSVAHPA